MLLVKKNFQPGNELTKNVLATKRSINEPDNVSLPNH